MSTPRPSETAPDLSDEEIEVLRRLLDPRRAWRARASIPEND